MGEEILRVRAEELTTIRLIFNDGIVHEMPIDRVKEYALQSIDVSSDATHALNGMVRGLQYFSQKGSAPGIEFVVPVKKSP